MDTCRTTTFVLIRKVLVFSISDVLCLDSRWWVHLVHLATQSTSRPSSWHEPFGCVTVPVSCFLHSSADNYRSVKNAGSSNDSNTCHPHSVPLIVPIPFHKAPVLFHLWFWFYSTHDPAHGPHFNPLMVPILFHSSLVPRPRPKIGKGAWCQLQRFPYVLCQQSTFGVEESRSSIANWRAQWKKGITVFDNPKRSKVNKHFPCQANYQGIGLTVETVYCWNSALLSC